MKKIASIFLALVLFVSAIPSMAISANAAVNEIANGISKIEIVQSQRILGNEGVLLDDGVYLYWSNVETFNYKVMFTSGASTTVTYTQLENMGVEIHTIKFIGEYYEYDDRCFFKAGKQPVQINLINGNVCTSYVDITSFSSWLLSLGINVSSDFDDMIIEYEGSEEQAYYWRIKPDQTNNYDLYSEKWNQINGNILIFDANNNVIPNNSGWNLKAGQEYAIRIAYKYNTGCYQDVPFWLEANRDHSHNYLPKTVAATVTKNGRIDYTCTSCGNVSVSKTINYPKTIKLSATSYTYNGKAKKPGVVVKDSAGKSLKEGTDYTITYPSGRKNVGSYNVVVKFKGNYSGTKTLTFKINPTSTKISKVSGGKKSLTVKYSKKSKQVTGYEVQYSTSKSFKSAKTKTVKGYKTTTAKVTKLKAKKKYYVRVRTYKTVGKTKYYSAWSSVKSTKTK